MLNGGGKERRLTHAKMLTELRP